MNDDIKKIIAEQLPKLPTDVRNSILSVDYSSQLQEVVKRNKLLIDQAGKLEVETTLTMLGLEPLSDYISNLERELQLPREKAVIVANDVDELVFKNIRESLKQMNEESLEPNNESSEELNREDVLEGIENPSARSQKEESISVSSLLSNNPLQEEFSEKITTGIEIRKETTPEIPMEDSLAIKNPDSLMIEKQTGPLHQNISPIDNIIEEKLTNTISVPREKIVVEEKTKIPQKSIQDIYREPIE